MNFPNLRLARFKSSFRPVAGQHKPALEQVRWYNEQIIMNRKWFISNVQLGEYNLFYKVGRGKEYTGVWHSALYIIHLY